MNRSIQEELISIGWAVCAILCFGFGFKVWAWIFTIAALISTIASISSAIKDRRSNISKTKGGAS